VQFNPKKDLVILLSVAFIFGALFFIHTAPKIWDEFEIHALITNPFLLVISLFLCAVFFRITLDKYGLSEFCFIPDALIVVSLIGMLLEIQEIKEFFQKGVIEAIKIEFNEHDDAMRLVKKELEQKIEENKNLKSEKSNLDKLKNEIETLTNDKIILNNSITESDQIIKSDPYIKIDYDLAKTLEKCGTCKKIGTEPETEACECKREIIKKAFYKPPFDDIVELNRMGYIILKKAGDVLDLDYGINNKLFIGSGLSTPFIKFNQSLPEYWSLNKEEKDNTVITCQYKNPPLALTDMFQTIDSFISTIKNTSDVSEDKNCKNKQLLTQIIERMRDKEKYKNTPPLFRCARFPTDWYKFSVGRPGAKRVYFSRLDDVLNLSISNACTTTGAKLDRTYYDNLTKLPIKIEDMSLFIWILIPETDQEARPATWENLIDLIKNQY